MPVLEIQPSADCSISSDSPNTAYNNDALLAGSFVLTGPGTIYRSPLRFPLTGLPAGATIDSAELQIAAGGGAFIGTPSFHCNLLEQTNWSELATWNRYDGVNLWAQPGGVFYDEDEDSYIYPGTGGLFFTGLRDQVRRCVTLGRSSFDPIIRGPEQLGTSNYFAGLSSAAAVEADRPKLIIHYHEPASQHNGLLYSVQAQLQSLATAGDLPAIDPGNVVARLVPAAKDIGSGAEKTYGLPALLVFPGANERFTPAMNDSSDIGYPIVVAVLEEPGNLTLGLTEDSDRYLWWRERIIHEFLHQYLTITAPATEFHDCLVEPGPIIDWNKWGADGLRVGSFTLRFITRKLNRQ